MNSFDSIGVRRAIICDKLTRAFDEFNGRQLGLILVAESDCRTRASDCSPYPIDAVFLGCIRHPKTQSWCRVSAYSQATDSLARCEEFRRLVRQCGALLPKEDRSSNSPGTQTEQESAAWISCVVHTAADDLSAIPLDDAGTTVWGLTDPWLRSIKLVESLGWTGDSRSSNDDGPCGMNGFRYHGRQKTGLTSKPFRLLRALWKAKDRTSTFDDLAEYVWDDKTRDGHSLRNDSRLGSARREVNGFMEAGAFPFRVRIEKKNEVASLIESVTQPIASPKSTGTKAHKSPRSARR